MPYYCTVPQCTSLAGRAKDVSFHQFPRDEHLAERWNCLLKRNKPYTKYSKVCSRHFRPEDYTMTHMGKNKGQWKTLNKDAVPTRNLPRMNPDGSLLVLRKPRSPKQRGLEGLQEAGGGEAQHHSLVALAKHYLQQEQPWYHPEPDEDDKDITIVIVKEEAGTQAHTLTEGDSKVHLDANVQTDVPYSEPAHMQHNMTYITAGADSYPLPSAFSTPLLSHLKMEEQQALYHQDN